MGLGRVLHSIPVRFRYICMIVSLMRLAELVRRGSSNSILRNVRGDVEPTRPPCSDKVGLDAAAGNAPSIDLTHKSTSHSEACIRAGRKLRDVNACSKIVAVGTSITFGSNGAHGENHPDRLRSQKDAWPAVLGTLLPGCHEVVNAGESACGPYCHVRRWHERPPSLFNEADVVILELTACSEYLAPNVAAAYLEAVFLRLAAEPIPPCVIFSSASFPSQLSKDATNYSALQTVWPAERFTAEVARHWGSPFVSLPQHLLVTGQYNSSDHRADCFQTNCRFFVDFMHLTRTGHRLFAELLHSAITELGVLPAAGASGRNARIEGALAKPCSPLNPNSTRLMPTIPIA